MRPFKKSWIFLVSFIFLLGFGCSQKSNQNTGEGQLRRDQVYLSGTVDTSGAPKDGVLITATDIDYIPGSSTSGSYTTQTNSDGYYAVALPSGVYNVTASGKGLQKAIRNMVRFSDPIANLDFILTATGDLTGRITYLQGSQEGLVVFLYGTQFMAVTDQSGTYKMNGIPIGTYRMGVIVPGDTGGGGGPFALTNAVGVAAGQTTNLGTIDGSEVNRFASIDYVSPRNIDQSHDPNHPVIIHRWEMFDDNNNLFFPDPGFLVKFDRPMDANTVIAGQTVLIEAPAAFAARNLHWKFDWGTYFYSDDPMNQMSSYSFGGQEIDGLSFYPSACYLTISPRDVNDHVVCYELPVGKYVIRITNSVKDKEGDHLYRSYVYAFEIQEFLYSAVGTDEDNDFLPNGVVGIDVGNYVAIGCTNRIDQSTLNLDTALTITPEPAGKKVMWDEGSEIRIYGLYAENTTYTIGLSATGLKTIYGDPIINGVNSVIHDDVTFGPFGQTFTFHFTTAAPKVAAIFPKNDSRENGICEPVALVFNTVTDRDSVQEHIHVYNDSNGIDKTEEIPAWQDDDSPWPSYKLTWVSKSDIPFPGYSNLDNGTNGENGTNGDNGDNGDNVDNGDCIDCECNSAACVQHLGDALLVSFPRQYEHAYRVELDGHALSFTGRNIAVFSASFRTKVPHLVDQDVDDGEIIEPYPDNDQMYSQMNDSMDGLYFRYNVGVDISDADFVLTADNATLPPLTPIPLDVQSYSGGAFRLRPQSLPCSTAFTLTMSNIKADDGSVIPAQTLHFFTENLKVVGTNPAQGKVNYYLDTDGTSDVVTVYFNGHLSDEMKEAVENNLDIIGSYYDPDADPPVTMPPNYPIPMFFWSGWGYEWSRLQIAFTMDPCTNYKVHLNADPATKALFFDHDQDPQTSDVPFLWVDRDLVFTTMCQEGEWQQPPPDLLYSTMPADGSQNISLKNRCIQLYFTPPYIQSGLDIEILAGSDQMVQDEDYYVQYPYYSYSSVITVCINKFHASTTYQVTVKGIDIPSNYNSPLHNNLDPDPYIFSFTTEPAKIEVESDNTRGLLTFTANSGYFKTSDFLDPATLTLKPDLRADNFEWKFYYVDINDGEESSEESTGEYANRAVLHYRPAQYALIEVQAPEAIDRYIPDPDWNPAPGEGPDDAPALLSGQFVNTPGKWVLNVSPDITLPMLQKVEQVKGGHYDYIRLFFNVAVDAETALDVSHYAISYKDESDVSQPLEVLKALNYECLQYDGWDSDLCDPEDDPPAILEPDGQLVLKTAPQNLVEYTLTVTGVKNASQRYTISGTRGIATFQGYIYPGQVLGASIVETLDSVRNVYDSPTAPYLWGVRVEKIGIQFDKPMNVNTTVSVIQPGENSGADIVITAGNYSQAPSCFDPIWYDSDAGSNTVLVVHCKYEATPGSGNYPPPGYNIRVTDKCRNAAGQALENTMDNEYRNVNPYALSPVDTAWLDETAPFATGDPATIQLDYSSYPGIVSPDAAGDSYSYRIIDPAKIGAPPEDPNAILDAEGNEVTVDYVETSTLPNQYLLRLTAYPVPTTTALILIYSNIPASTPIPSWFPIEALKDVGYSHITGPGGTSI